MSVLIKGMTIPKAGGVLLFIDASGIATEGVLQEIAPTISGFEHEYDVVEIPPHGRLIDADALKDALTDHNNVLHSLTWGDVNYAPTITEAEE